MASFTDEPALVVMTSHCGGSEPGAYPSVLRAMRSNTVRCTRRGTPLVAHNVSASRGFPIQLPLFGNEAQRVRQLARLGLRHHPVERHERHALVWVTATDVGMNP